MRNFVCLFFLILWVHSAWSQDILDQTLDFSVHEQSIPDCLQLLAQQSGIPIAFSSRFFDSGTTRSLDLQHQSLGSILEKILEGTEIAVKSRNGGIVLYRKKTTQQQYWISGYVTDAESGERITGATIYSPTPGIGTHSNEYGFYSMKLPAGPALVIVSYVGTQRDSLQLALAQNQSIHWELQQTLSMEEVVINQHSEDFSHHQDYQIGMRSINKRQLLAAPDLMGEEDLVQHVRLHPGIQSGADGIGGLHVRGGNNSQNLLLLDGVPVYNASHLIGVFSIFNASAIRHAKVLTGGFPARYGGRLSSVLDIHTREGNQKKWGGELGIGLLGSKATIEGPLLGGKGAVLLTGRTTWIDEFLAPSVVKVFTDEEVPFSTFGFYDLNSKINVSFSPSNRLYLSLYQGGDSFFLERDSVKIEDFFQSQESELNWGNRIASLRWNHIFGPQLFSNLTLTYSRYQFHNAEFFRKLSTDSVDEKEFFFEGYESDIQDWAAKMDVHYYPSSRHNLRFGGGLTRHHITPKLTLLDDETEEFLSYQFDSIDDFESLINGPEYRSYETFLYLEEVYQPQARWYLNVGSRFSAFLNDDKAYAFLEPRISIRHSLRPRLFARLGISRMVQYLHQISNTNLNLPNDVWLPSSASVAPQRSWQWEAGIQYSPADQWQLSFDLYYKRMNHLHVLPPFINYQEAADNLEEVLYEGSGDGYGFECVIEKKGNRTHGWLSYGLGKANRQFEDENLGLPYPYQFDRRHQINLAFFHKFSSTLSMSTSWTYASANPLLIVEGEERVNIFEPGFKNSERSFPYHHLDVGLVYERNTSFGQHRIKLGVYNLYNRRNIAFHRLSYSPFTEEESLSPVNIMPILPSLSYSLKL